MERWSAHPAIEILGNPDPDRRIGIISFNIKDSSGRYLHPRFVTVLLNDLFGVQSRGGCSCAGPYGHRLLGIEKDKADAYRTWVHQGYQGIKPGWCRIGMHYVFDDEEALYLIAAVLFVADNGDRFLPNYDFDPHTGSWQHRQDERTSMRLSLSDALVNSGAEEGTCLVDSLRHQIYQNQLAEAKTLADGLPAVVHETKLKQGLEGLRFFRLPEESMQKLLK